MSPPSASAVVTGGIVALSVLMVLAWVWLLWRANPPGRTMLTARFALGLLGWAGLWCGLAAAGVLSNLDRKPPLFITLIPLMVILVAVLSRSVIGAVLAFETPLWLLVGMQAFRLPLELVMHQAAAEGVMPAQMSFGGLNYDIVTGATALLLGLVLTKRTLPKPLLLGWNVLGSLLLVNIVVVSVLSTPLFARFGSDPAHLNTWVMYAPFVWLPAVLVGSALLGHVLIFRKLLSKT